MDTTLTGTASIVVGHDGSQASRQAVDWAADEAERTGASLRIVHAYQLGWPAGTSYRPTAQEADEARGRAEELVVGSRGHGGFTGLLLGSVGQQLMHHAGCPVLIAHRPA
ncbi:universal stress protein [Dactylosporangium sp. NPDC049742]|uniref:universal stress protein n=1 Tax=Dactylosporangium sp. NPDC049742 TaxID=3154737 RepID=UPI00342DD87A